MENQAFYISEPCEATSFQMFHCSFLNRWKGRFLVAGQVMFVEILWDWRWRKHVTVLLLPMFQWHMQKDRGFWYKRRSNQAESLGVSDCIKVNWNLQGPSQPSTPGLHASRPSPSDPSWGPSSATITCRTENGAVSWPSASGGSNKYPELWVKLN